MDLEMLKKEWQNNAAFKKEVKDSMVKEMIANRNKGAFERIKNYEKQALRIIPVCVIAFVLMNFSIFLHGNTFGIVWVLLMLPIGALLWYWSYWLCGFLDKIDMSRMNVTEATRYILKYRTYLIRHTVGAVLLTPAYMGVWHYCYASANSSHFSELLTKEYYIVYLLILVVLLLVILWFRFFKHIRSIRDNLKELEQFEQE